MCIHLHRIVCILYNVYCDCALNMDFRHVTDYCAVQSQIIELVCSV